MKNPMRFGQKDPKNEALRSKLRGTKAELRRSHLLRTLDNNRDGVSSAFPWGKNTLKKGSFLDIINS
ncbi:MAG: hypothetical protein JRF62_11430 [Deltaproteobacteria bacterium]|nr:hypothetical protein [Deltaproteobacteria bacterium]MBW2640532.1 hypothetical protein [Deltaproteobacteria bacterium]